MKRLACVLFFAGCAPGATSVPFSAPSPVPNTSGQFLSGTASGRTYKLYVPSTYSSTALPLVVMLHGCSQDPDDFAAGTQMNTLAEAQGFFAVYPQEKSSDNLEECWNWFQTADQARGSGEPASIIGVIDQVASSYMVDASRVYALGVSSGGAMATILGATYPDRISAIASGSGLEYKAATSLTAATSAESKGGPSPVTQGKLAYEASGTNVKSVRAFVVQGTSDNTVAPVNGMQVVDQWIATEDLATDGVADGNVSTTAATTMQGQVTGGHAYTITTYVDATTGKTMVEYVSVTGMNHAWSGGSSSGSYTDPMGPNATQMAWDFFTADVATVDAGTPFDLATSSTDAGTSDAAMVAPDMHFQVVTGGSPNYGSGCSMAPKRNSAPTALTVGALLVFATMLRRRKRS